MFYKESSSILKQIKKAKRILLNCHRGPDPDSFGSTLALYKALSKMGKTLEIICPSTFTQKFSNLANFEKTKTVSFAGFDFSKFDLFIIADSSSWEMVSDNGELPVPDIPIAVIDHHLTNKKFGLINLVDSKIGSCAEVVYKVLKDWGTNA